MTKSCSDDFWVSLNGQELFISFKHFPWFKEVPIRELLNVVHPHAGHLY